MWTGVRQARLAPVDQLPAVDAIEGAIHIIRGQRVMLDANLARLYGVKTERLNEQVRRNPDRFPSDFAFRLTEGEWRNAMCPQFAGTLRRTRRVDYLLRAFVHLRSALAANTELAARVDELAREVGRQGERMLTHDQAILKLLAQISRLTRFPETPRRGIGFTADRPTEK